jgi:nucleoside-diphosphate-sugar epimerase
LTVVVTGATGHVGANLVRALVEAGEDVRAIVRDYVKPLEGLEVEQVKADILSVDTLKQAFNGAEFVYHLAGYISILEYHAPDLNKINIEGTRNVVKACLDCKIKRLVYTSSIEALMQPGGPDPIDETDPSDPTKLPSAYSRSKWAASLEVLEGVKNGLDAVIVHPTAVVGPNDFKPSLLGQTFIEFAHRKLPAFVPGGFDFVDVRDLASGIIAAAKKGRSGERYLLSGSFVDLPSLASTLEESTGVARPRMIVPLWLAKFAARFTPLYYRNSKARPRFTTQSLKLLNDGRHVSCAKAKTELDYNPRPGLEAVRAAVGWFTENNYIRKIYRSKKDPGIVILVSLFVLVCLAGGIFELFHAAGWNKLFGAAGLLVGILYFLISWPVAYELTPQMLLVRGGPFRWKIPLDTIKEVSPSRTPLSAPAWSWKRLQVRYLKNDKTAFVLISPKDHQVFMKNLAQLAPGLEMHDSRLVKAMKKPVIDEQAQQGVSDG